MTDIGGPVAPLRGVIDLRDLNRDGVGGRGLLSASEFARAMLGARPDPDLTPFPVLSQVQPPDGQGDDLVVRSAQLTGRLDLSFNRVNGRLVLVDCVLDEAATFEGADVGGLEFHRCQVPGLTLDWVHIRGDLRLVDLRARSMRSVDKPVRVAATGTMVDGHVDLTGSHLDAVDEEVLVGSSVRASQVALEDASRTGLNWDLVLQLAGLASGLAAWVTVVGGARLWARMVAIDAPALPTLAGIGQSWMVAEGLQTLLVPILLGVVVSLLVYFSRWERRPTHRSRRDQSEENVQVQVAAGGALQTSQGIDPLRERGPGRAQSKPEVKQAPPDRVESAHSRNSDWSRARPLRALQRLRRTTRAASGIVLVGLVGLLAVGLLIAQASWQVLVSTLLVLAAGVAAIAGPESATRPGEAAQDATLHGTPREAELPAGNTSEPAAPPVAIAGTLPLLAAIAAVTGIAVGLVWWLSHQSWQFAGVAALVASVLVISVAVLANAFTQRGEAPRATGVALLGGIALLGVLLSLAATVRLPWLVAMGLVTVLAVWVTLGAVVDKSPKAAAVTVFVAIVLWSGALGYAREIGDRTPDLSLARVDLRDGSSVGGYFLGRSSGHVFLAQDAPDESKGRHVLTLADEDVERVVYGRKVVPLGTAAPVGSSWSFLADGDLTSVDPDVVAPGPGTQGLPPDPSTGEPIVEPTYTPSPENPFEPTAAVASRDETVSGVPVRLELIGLRRSRNVVHLDLRVLNMAQTAHSAAEMLALSGGSDFDTPRLTDAKQRRVYRVSARPGGCDCSGGLRGRDLESFESLRLWAMVVVPRSIATVDLTVPSFGTFQDVAIN